MVAVYSRQPSLTAGVRGFCDLAYREVSADAWISLDVTAMTVMVMNYKYWF